MPWSIFGDFNDILFPSKKSGGGTFDYRVTGDFMGVMDRRGLHDAGFVGYPFTWSNKREGVDHIKDRLDRFLCNDKWDEVWLSSKVRNIIWEGSDHYPILLITGEHLNSHVEMNKTNEFKAF